MKDLALTELAAEVKRQDQFHPAGYPATRDGVFLGIKTAAHELDVEAIGAWRTDRCRCGTPLCGHADWQNTRGELLQAAAVILRTIRSIDDAATRQHGRAWLRGEMTHDGEGDVDDPAELLAEVYGTRPEVDQVNAIVQGERREVERDGS